MDCTRPKKRAQSGRTLKERNPVFNKKSPVSSPEASGEFAISGNLQLKSGLTDHARAPSYSSMPSV